MRWRSRERKCKIETHVGAGHEIAKREGVELRRTLTLGWGFGWRWARVSVGVGQGLGRRQLAETKCED